MLELVDSELKHVTLQNSCSSTKNNNVTMILSIALWFTSPLSEPGIVVQKYNAMKFMGSTIYGA